MCGCCLVRVWWWVASALEEVGPSEVLEVLAAANVLHRPRARGRAEEVLLEVREGGGGECELLLCIDIG